MQIAILMNNSLSVSDEANSDVASTHIRQIQSKTVQRLNHANITFGIFHIKRRFDRMSLITQVQKTLTLGKKKAIEGIFLNVT